MKKLIKCATDALGGRVTIKIMINERKEEQIWTSALQSDTSGRSGN